MMFGGEFHHSVDGKGRITIPSKFREELGEECVVSRGFDGCLNIYSVAEWESQVGGLLKVKRRSKDLRELIRHLFSKMITCTYDKQGRILISQELREIANIDKNVVLVGNGDHIQLFDEERYMADSEISDERLSDLADKVFGELAEVGE